MEFFGALAGEPLKVCLRKLEKCDVYLGIIGQTYGTTEKRSGKSFTQLEYEHAKKLYRRKKLKDIWIFLPSDECAFPVKHTESDPKKMRKLTKFRELARRDTVDFYDSLDDLKLKVVIQCFKDKTGVNQISPTAALPDILRSGYDEYLDSTYDMISIEGVYFLPSAVLKSIDNVAYRQGFLDWQIAQTDAEEQG